MEAIFDRTALYEAVQAISGALNVRAPRPALQCVHVAAKGKEVVLSATDLRIAIRRRVDAKKVVQEGEAAVQGARLGALLREVTDEDVRIKVDAKTAAVTAGRSSFRLVAHDPADFAELPTFKRADVRVSPDVFDALVRRTVFAAAQEQGRYAIDGVALSVAKGEMVVAATDGRRLAVATAAVEKGGDLAECIVPPKMLVEVRRQGSGADVELQAKGGRLIARVGDTVVAGALIEGSFPAFRDMVPPPAEAKLRVSPGVLASKLRQASQLTTEDSRAIVLKVAPSVLTIEAKGAGVGEASIEMDATYGGSEMSVAFNAQYLLDVLAEFPDEDLEIEMPGAEKPAVVRREGYVYVLAPVRVSA